MNILLFAPALFLAYLSTQGFLGTIKQLSICASVQLALAYPFLSTYPWSYLKGAFDLGRIFIYRWTVNWRFLPEDVFLHPGLHIGLLVAHALLLLLAMLPWWRLLQRYR
jgi:alpha-1,3-mannosyltransferase